MKSIFKLLALLLVSPAAWSQSLPHSQKVSLLASTDQDIATDQTSTPEHFSAYDNHNQCYYTISNDDNNLYLSVGFDKKRSAEKFSVGGLTLTVKQTNNSKKGLSAAVTYPSTKYTHNGIENGFDEFKELKDSLKKEKLSELPYVYNQKIRKVFIGVNTAGISGVPDSISVKNAYGIKAIAGYDKNMWLIYHLSIPLKLLGLNNGDAFKYELRMNGTPKAVKKAPGEVENVFLSFAGEVNYDYEYLYSATYSSGECKLAETHK